MMSWLHNAFKACMLTAEPHLTMAMIQMYYLSDYRK